MKIQDFNIMFSRSEFLQEIETMSRIRFEKKSQIEPFDSKVTNCKNALSDSFSNTQEKHSILIFQSSKNNIPVHDQNV